MFLFRRRKEPSENKKQPADLAQAAVSGGNEKTAKPAEIADPFKSKTGSPVTVIPASALKEDAPAEPVAAKTPESTKAPVPEEVVDALLVKVNKDEPEKQAAPAAAPPPKAPEIKPEPAKKATEGEGKGNLFSNIFGGAVEVEETPLDRMVKSLPDIGIDEVLNEAEEVKGLMSEWYQGQKR